MADHLGVAATKLRVVKGRSVILDTLDFTIKQGVITGLIGPSGSGKTTLMRAIVGVQTLAGGKLTVLNHPAGNRALRSRIGYMSQDLAIYSDLTVQQNLRYFAALIGAPSRQIDQIINQVQLTDHQNQLVANLSGGQKARVSLAITLLGDPDLLVMDEPTVGLDPLLREELWQLFASLAKNGKTLLISSHVMDEAEKCNNLLLLRQGRLLWQDSRDKLLATTATKSVQDAFIHMIKGAPV